MNPSAVSTMSSTKYSRLFLQTLNISSPLYFRAVKLLIPVHLKSPNEIIDKHFVHLKTSNWMKITQSPSICTLGTEGGMSQHLQLETEAKKIHSGVKFVHPALYFET